jgi:hypothetical protein
MRFRTMYFGVCMLLVVATTMASGTESEPIGSISYPEIDKCMNIIQEDLPNRMRASLIDSKTLEEACFDLLTEHNQVGSDAETRCLIYVSMNLQALAIRHCADSADQGSIQGTLSLASIYLSEGATYKKRYVERIAPELERLISQGNIRASLLLYSLYEQFYPDRALELLTRGAASGSYAMQHALCQSDSLPPYNPERIAACDRVIDKLRSEASIDHSHLVSAVTLGDRIRGYDRVQELVEAVISDTSLGSEAYNNAILSIALEHITDSFYRYDEEHVYRMLTTISSIQQSLDDELLQQLAYSYLMLGNRSLKPGHTLYPQVKHAFQEIALLSSDLYSQVVEYCSEDKAPVETGMYQFVCETSE